MVDMLAHSPLVIGIAGRIGSGKTAVAQCLALEFGFEYIRYSQVLAEWFEINPADKASLQEIGEQVMTGEHQRELNRRLISRINREAKTVVDGLRHPVDYESLASAYHDEFALVFIQTPEGIRFQRLQDRFASYSEFKAADSRTVESHIDALCTLATWVVPGTVAPAQLKSTLGEIIQQLRQRTGA